MTSPENILIIGTAGFVGSSLALHLKIISSRADKKESRPLA
jgi:hypothetical protein